MQKNVKYLGHIEGEGCRIPAESKVQATADPPPPHNVNKTEIRRFQELTEYYSPYIRKYATILEPLT